MCPGGLFSSTCMVEEDSKSGAVEAADLTTSCLEMTSRKSCSGCRQAITDPFVMEVGQEHWHESCLTCHACRAALENTCYQRDGKLLCKTDYDRLYGIKCSICNQLVPRRELVMRVLGNIYHLECFLCTHCGHALQKGEAFVIRSGKLICSMCLDREAMAYQHCVAFGPLMTLSKGDENNMLMVSQSHTASETARRGPKRPRTILSSHQRRAFKTSFEVSPKPCRKVRESLAKDLGLSVRVVQVWFQNQRAKIKKLQRRQLTQTQQNSAGTSDKNGSDDEEDDAHSRLDSSAEEELNSSDEEKSVSETFTERRAEKAKKSTTKKPKSKAAAQTSIKDSGNMFGAGDEFGGSDFVLETLTAFSTSPRSPKDQAAVGDQMESSSGVADVSLKSFAERMDKGHSNPIDSLYSMQASYFNV